MYKNGLLFGDEFQKELKEKFYYADADPLHGERLFFDNSGGSLRLKKCVEAKTELEKFPIVPKEYTSVLFISRDLSNTAQKRF